MYTFTNHNNYNDESPNDFKTHAWNEYEGTRNNYHTLVYKDNFGAHS